MKGVHVMEPRRLKPFPTVPESEADARDQPVKETGEVAFSVRAYSAALRSNLLYGISTGWPDDLVAEGRRAVLRTPAALQHGCCLSAAAGVYRRPFTIVLLLFNVAHVHDWRRWKRGSRPGPWKSRRSSASIVSLNSSASSMPSTSRQPLLAR